MLKNSLLIALLALALSGCGYTMSRSSQESAPAGLIARRFAGTR